MADPVAVTVEVPVSGSDEHVEVTVTLSARRVPAAPPYLDSLAIDDEPPPQAAPSAVFGRNVAGVRQPTT